ncbi:right-handed parallel beta-helix repeat-containing protein [Mucilaginibacter pallidiroseus]|uniref:Right-handed parallel beta-helix repeat-containing protein n=1 Tax=Mucilaginibacter pallidiroseus TaxID=2599295 RepID=A0A563UJM6_9SPHI|nr:right-handed parallel beta-helix repeat-containing protein [Mucilaginibacter pallidiroseus]TWR31523.1 right-handed parallel beta-helix repeat-containing protein [Mucilaginibacter pallidiroseus]
MRLITIYLLLFLSCNAAGPKSGRGTTQIKTPLILKTSKPVLLQGAHDVIISGKEISGGKLPAIHLINCYNIRIVGNRLTKSANVGIELYNCHNITIDSNYISEVSTGVYADKCVGGIVVTNNIFLNMKGPFPRGQFVQFNNVTGPGCLISHNKCENVLGKSYPEDAISIYQSSGTLCNPIRVERNLIRGGGPSASGGGIMLGDGGGQCIRAKNNVLVNPGQYGMAIAGGSHISIIANTIYGKARQFTNVGLYVNSPAKTSTHTVSDNRVLFFNKSGNQNNSWLAPGTPQPIGWSSNVFGAKLDEALIPADFISKR